MGKLKLRMIKVPGENYPTYGVIDTCDNLKDRVMNDNRYMWAFKIREDGYINTILPVEEMGCYYNQLDICSDDIFLEPDIKDYVLFSAVLKKNGFVFNKKKNELIKKSV